MKNSITWVGMDDSAKKIDVVIFHGQPGAQAPGKEIELRRALAGRKLL